MKPTRLNVTQKALAEFRKLFEAVDVTVKSEALPFVIYFEHSNPKKNLKDNKRVAIRIVASERLFHRVIASTPESIEAYERAKVERGSFFNTGLHLVIYPDLLLMVEDYMKLMVKDQELAYSDLIKFYRSWTGLTEPSNENNRALADMIKSHQKKFLKYITKK